MHNKYKIERATPQFDRRGSTTTIETSFNISPENIQPKLDSVDLKSVNTNLNIKSSSGMENAGADHLYSTALTSNILPKLPNTPSLNLGVADAGEPNHGYVSDFHNAAGVGGRKPSMPVSRALVSTEDKTGGADYTDSAPYSGSLNKNKYGGSGKTEIISLETNRDNRNGKKYKRKIIDDKENNDQNNQNNQDDREQKGGQTNQGSSQKNQQIDQTTNQTDRSGNKMSSGEWPIQKLTQAKVHCLDASKDGSVKKTTVSENGSVSETPAMTSMKAFYKVPKSVVVSMVTSLIILFVLLLLVTIIFGAIIASLNKEVDRLKRNYEKVSKKVDDTRTLVDNSSLIADANKVNDTIKHSDESNYQEQIEGLNLTIIALETKMGNLDEKLTEIYEVKIPQIEAKLEQTSSSDDFDNLNKSLFLDRNQTDFQLSHLEDEMNDINSTLNRVDDTLITTQDGLTNLTDQVNEWKFDIIPDFEIRIETLENDTERNEKSIKSLSDSEEVIKSRIGTAEQRITNLGG